jgi:hypothetical protein
MRTLIIEEMRTRPSRRCGRAHHRREMMTATQCEAHSASVLVRMQYYYYSSTTSITTRSGQSDSVSQSGLASVN